MKKEEIFLNDSWTKENQDVFWKILNSKRGQKLSYVSTKAYNLAKTNPRNAINLLTHFVDEYSIKKNEILKKEKYPLVYKSHICDFCLDIGEYYEELSDWDSAEKSYLNGGKIFYADEVDANLKAKRKYEGYLKLIELFLKFEKNDLAFIWLNKFEKLFPSESTHDDYYFNLHIRFAYLTGDFSKSDKLHEKYYSKNKNYLIIRSYAELEAKPYISNASNLESSNIEDAAEAFIVYHHAVCLEIFNKTKDSLMKLDSLLKTYKIIDGETFYVASYKTEFLNNSILPELGSYIGEVFINEFKGKWVQGKLLMESRIKIGKHIINPFEYSYKVLFFGHRLIEEVYNKVETIIKK